jgi:hypothetical protein
MKSGIIKENKRLSLVIIVALIVVLAASIFLIVSALSKDNVVDSSSVGSENTSGFSTEDSSTVTIDLDDEETEKDASNDEGAR